jgi:hypothetical protein
MANLDVGNKPDIGGSSYVVGGATGDTTIDATTISVEKQGKIEKDTLEVSETTERQLDYSEVESDNPKAPPPKGEMLTDEEQTVEEFKANLWFAPSMLASFINAVNQLLQMQKEQQFKEAQNELIMRDRLFEMAKSSGALARELMNNQAQEQIVQAVASFATAAISVGQAVQTVRNVGAAEREVKANKEINDRLANQQKRVDDAQKNLDKLQNENNVAASDSEADLTSKVGDAKAKDILNARKELDKEQQKLDELQSERRRDILTRQQHKDGLTQTLTDVYKSTINGVQGVLLANIKWDSGVKEELQKILDGFIQAMNKYSETTTKSRDDAAACFKQFQEFLNRAIELLMRAHGSQPH